MKLSKIPLFWKIWIFHFTFFYTLFGLLSEIYYFGGYFGGNYFRLNRILKGLEVALWAPLFGLFGAYDNMLLLPVIQIIVMYFFNRKFPNIILLNYILSIVLLNIVFYCIPNNRFNYGYPYVYPYNSYYLYFIPSFLITLIVNWLIFRKHYYLLESRNPSWRAVCREMKQQ